jgi:hypothetical protein
MVKSRRHRSRKSRKHRKGGKLPGQMAAISLTKGATKAASRGEAMAKSATKMCGAIENAFLRGDCEKRVKKSADAAKAKMEGAKKQLNVAEKKLTGVKAKATALQKKIDQGGLAAPKMGGKRKRRTKRRRKKRKSKKSRKKSRKSKRRRKSKKRRSRRR